MGMRFGEPQVLHRIGNMGASAGATGRTTFCTVLHSRSAGSTVAEGVEVGLPGGKKFALRIAFDARCGAFRAMLAMTYGNIYVAKVAVGASDAQCVKAFVEAETYDGPSLIIAYCHCIAHGIDMTTGMDIQKSAVASGHWPLFRYNPLAAADGRPPLHLDSKAPSIPYKDYAYKQTRFNMLAKSNPEEARRLLELAQQDASARVEAL